MDRLWGEMLPVPHDNLQVLVGGERLAVAGRELLVEYLPGHAWHHVGFLDIATRTAFVGDTGGIRVGEPLVVMPPTPPPDIDLEAWEDSLERILAWQPERLFVTHFGGFGGPREHIAALRARLRQWAAIVEVTLADASLDDEKRAAAFVRNVGEALAREIGREAADRCVRAVSLAGCWAGLARYFRKRAAS
jgi:glyoxylase-like metal-dependent hydrolase (beta-lactamase superfamily II)